MKRILTFILILSAVLLSAADWYKIQPGGHMGFDGISFRLNTWNDGWKGSIIDSKSKKLVPESGYPKAEKDGSFEHKGVYYLAKGEFQYHAVLQIPAADRIRYTQELTSPEPMKIDCSAMEGIISNRRWKENPVLIDGKIYDFETGKTQRNIGKVNELLIPVKGGNIRIKGEFQVALVDISKSSYAPDSRYLRIMPIPASGMLKKMVYDLEITYESEKAQPLDLRPAMNMGFQDDVAEDGKGGWTDQGAANDLRQLQVGLQQLDNVDFDIIDPAKNEGKSCISLRGSARTYFPEKASAEFPEPVQGSWLYLLHATAWDAPKGKEVGNVMVTYADGSTETHVLLSKIHVANFWQPQPLDQAAIAWRGENDVAAIGLYATRLPLKKSGVKKLEFQSAGSSVWMIVAASVSDKKIPGKEIRKTVMQAGGDWIPIEGSPEVKPGSILDFSSHLDAPAGKYGFAQNENGKIVFERKKEPIRFYGANICFDLNFMKDKKDIDLMADSFARIGYNLVRLHHFDGGIVAKEGDGTELREDFLDSFDYTLYAFKKRGIYLEMDLYTIRSIGKNKIPSYPNGVDGASYKALVWADPDCTANFLKFSKHLMSHVNPYTGTAWKDEPAIVNINLVNEGNVVNRTHSKNAQPVFEKHFGEFMKRNDYTTGQFEKERYWKLFLTEFYPKSYNNVVKELRKMGVRQMLCDQNYCNDILTMITREPYDIIENHFYWGHPAFLKTQWALPALVQNISAIDKLGGFLAATFQTKALDKPFCMTEWDFVSPNRYNAEGAFLTGAYAALQDWNGLCRFAYGHSAKILKQSPARYFDIANDPLRLLSERAGILFFTRGDVKASDVKIPLLLNRQHFAVKDAKAEGIVPTRIGLIAGTGNLLFTPGEPTVFPAGVKAVITVDPIGKEAAGSLPSVDSADHLKAISVLEKQGVLPPGSENFKAKRYRSTTGELELDGGNTTFKAITPRSEGFVLEEGKILKGKFAEIRNRKNFCAVLIASMDEQSLTGSRRFLLLHLTDSKNTGMVFADEEMQVVEDYGKLPILIRKGVAEITLNRDFSKFKLYPVKNDGARLPPLPLRVENGKTSFTLDTSNAMAYELTAE